MTIQNLAGLSPSAVSTMLRLGYAPDEAARLLRLADEQNDHPDWSEDSDAEISVHFAGLAAG